MSTGLGQPSQPSIASAAHAWSYIFIYAISFHEHFNQTEIWIIQEFESPTVTCLVLRNHTQELFQDVFVLCSGVAPIEWGVIRMPALAASSTAHRLKKELRAMRATRTTTMTSVFRFGPDESPGWWIGCVPIIARLQRGAFLAALSRGGLFAFTSNKRLFAKRLLLSEAT